MKTEEYLILGLACVMGWIVKDHMGKKVVETFYV